MIAVCSPQPDYVLIIAVGFLVGVLISEKFNKN